MEKFDLINYSIVGILVLNLSLLIGNILFNIENRSILIKLSLTIFLGLSLIVSLIGTIRCLGVGSITFLFLFLISFIDYKISVNEIIKKLKFLIITHKWSIFLINIVFLITISYTWFLYYNTKYFLLPNWDNNFYSTTSYMIFKYGIESFINKPDSFLLTIKPLFYHFYELWINGVICNMFQLISIKCLLLITYPIGSTLLLTGVLGFFYKNVGSKSKYLLPVILICTQIIYLGPLKIHPSFEFKYIYILVVLVYLFDSILDKKHNFILFLLCILPLIYCSTLFITVFLFIVCIILFNRFNIKVNKSISLIFIATIIYYIFIIVIQDKVITQDEIPSFKNIYKDVLYHIFYSFRNVLFSPFYISYLFLIIFLNYKINTFYSKQEFLFFYKYFSVFFILFNIGTIIFSAVYLIEIDAPQVLTNFMTSFNVLFFLYTFGVLFKMNLFNLYFLRFIFISSIIFYVYLFVNNTIPFLNSKSFFEKVDRNFVVKLNGKCLNKKIAYIKFDSLFYGLEVNYKNAYSLKNHANIGLYFNDNFISYPIYRLNVANSLLFKNNNWNNYIDNHNYKTLAEYQFNFIKDNNINIILGDEKSTLSSNFKAYIIDEQNDKISGFKYWELNFNK